MVPLLCPLVCPACAAIGPTLSCNQLHNFPSCPPLQAVESKSQRGISPKRVAGSSASLRLPAADGGDANDGGAAAAAGAATPQAARASEDTH